MENSIFTAEARSIDLALNILAETTTKTLLFFLLAFCLTNFRK